MSKLYIFQNCDFLGRQNELNYDFFLRAVARQQTLGIQHPLFDFAPVKKLIDLLIFFFQDTHLENNKIEKREVR